MYYYILDLGNKNVTKIKEKMEVMMASYGISGDFGKVSPLASAYQLAKKAVEEGYSTIVAVGNTEIINQTAAALINTKSAMGIVPIEADRSICTLIGGDNYREALGILRMRKIQTIDVGRVGENYFLTETFLSFPQPVPVVLDFGQFRLGGEFQKVVISNGNETKQSFLDGLLTIKIDQPEKRGFLGRFFQKSLPSSLLFQKKVTIETEKEAPLYVDREVVAKTPCQIKIIPLALQLVVSRLHSS